MVPAVPPPRSFPEARRLTPPLVVTCRHGPRAAAEEQGRDAAEHAGSGVATSPCRRYAGSKSRLPLSEAGVIAGFFSWVLPGSNPFKTTRVGDAPNDVFARLVRWRRRPGQCDCAGVTEQRHTRRKRKPPVQPASIYAPPIAPSLAKDAERFKKAQR